MWYHWVMYLFIIFIYNPNILPLNISLLTSSLIQKISDYRKTLDKYSFDKEYLIDMYNRWLDNEKDTPLQRNMISEQLLGQTCDCLLGNDSGNRVFAMIMQMPSDKRRLSIGR